MSDLQEEMERTKKRAAAFGVNSETDDEDGTNAEISEKADKSNTASSTDEDESVAVAPSEMSAGAETAETSGSSPTSEALETPETQATVEKEVTSELEESESTPNQESSEAGVSQESAGESEPTSDTKTEDADETSRGRLIDEYDNVNIYIPPELKRELNDLFKLMDLECSRSKGEDLEKHWDFYPAVVRTVLQNEDDLRSELDIDT